MHAQLSSGIKCLILVWTFIYLPILSMPAVLYAVSTTVNPVLSGHSKIDKRKVLMANGSLMKVKSIAECSPWSILQYFWPTLSNNRYLKPIFGLLFEWPLQTIFTVIHGHIY